MSMPTRRFANDDDAAQHWLTVLRDGDDHDRVEAREQLAAIFERRGMIDEAIELLAGNVRAGHATAEGYRWIARLFKAQGDEISAMQAAAEAAKLMPPPLAASPPPEALVRPVKAAAVTTAPSLPSKPRPWYLRTPALIGASVLCVPPLALVFVWMRPWRGSLKIAVSVPLGIWTVLWLFSVMSGALRPSQPSTTALATAAVTAQVAAVKSEPTQRPPTATPAPPTSTPVPPTSTPAPDPSVVAYKGYMGEHFMKAGQALQNMANLSQRASSNPLLLKDRNWQIGMTLELSVIKAEGQKLQDYDPVPAKAKGVDDQIVGLGKDLVYIADEMQAGITIPAPGRITNAVNRMDAMNAKLAPLKKQVEEL